MANPIPALSVVKYKGSGNVQVFKLLNGTTLDPVQDGNDVLTGTLETPVNDQNNQANRVIEAFGKRYLVHGYRVYERDSGGAGNWGEVTALALSSTAQFHSGLHLLHPNGVPTLVFMCSISFVIYAVWTQDGTSWTQTNTGLGTATDRGNAGAVVWGTSLAWYINGNNTNCVKVYDFALGTAFEPSGLTNIKNNSGNCYLAVHKGFLYVLAPDNSNNLNLYRVDGTAASLVHQIASTGTFGISSNCSLFSDGDDLVAFWSNSFQRRSTRYSNVLPGETAVVDTGTTILGGLAYADPSAFYPFVSTDPDPSVHEQRVYFWYRRGDINTGSFELFRFNYREISHGAVTSGPFLVGSRVLQATSSAEGTITDVGAGTISLTDVTGTFNNTDVISTVGGGASAAATSLLVDVAATSLGTGPSATNFGLPSVLDGGLPRIPVAPSARIEFEGQPIEESGGYTRWYFRCYGSGPAIDISMFFDVDSGAPGTQATLVNASLVVESGTPTTTPTITNGTTIDNVTPDDGTALYSFQHDATTDGIGEGLRYNTLLDVV